jgi:prevent-host-death family protein
MKVMSAGKAKNGFGLLIDTARAEPVTIEKHGRPVAVMLSVEEYERLLSSIGPAEKRVLIKARPAEHTGKI